MKHVNRISNRWPLKNPVAARQAAAATLHFVDNMCEVLGVRMIDELPSELRDMDERAARVIEGDVRK